MEEIAQILRKTRPFHVLQEGLLEELILPAGQLRDYPRDVTLIHAQQRVDQVLVLLQGRVSILHQFADGSYSLSNTLSPPRLLGLDLLCTRTRISPYDARSCSECRIFSFPAHLLDSPRMSDRQRLALKSQLLDMVAHMNMQKEYRIAILSQSGLRNRILIYLSMQAARCGGGSFTAPFSREELAAYLCVNRSALSHELSRMRQEGLIDFRKNTFTLLRPAQSQALF